MKVVKKLKLKIKVVNKDDLQEGMFLLKFGFTKKETESFINYSNI